MIAIKSLWMEITQDHYELPIAVAGSIAELARMRGVSEHSIRISMSRQNTGQVKSKPKYIRIEMEEDED